MATFADYGCMLMSEQADRALEEQARLLRQCLDGLAGLGAIIRLHDRDLWQVSDPPFAKLRHIHTHLSKTVGRLAAMVEPLDHVADAEGARNVPTDEWADELAPLVADLLIHASQLADLASLNLGSALHSRWERNAQRFSPESEFAALIAATAPAAAPG